MNDTNTTTKPGVLDVMNFAADAMLDGSAMGQTACNEIREARATVERLLSAAEGAEAFIGVMFGSVNGRLPETVDTPLGIPVKLGAIARDLSAALAAFRGEA